MSFAKFGVMFATVALAVVSAASSELNITSPVTAAGKKLMGTYKVTVEGEKVMLTKGKEVVELPATVEKSPSKYHSTQYTTKGSQLEELQLGGTTMDIKIKAEAPTVPAGGGH